LTALHRTAEILRKHHWSPERTINRLLSVLPSAWQYPELTGMRIKYDGWSYATGNFRATRWMQTAEFLVSKGKRGTIEVCYLAPRPPRRRGPFLLEERALLNSLAEMLKSYFQRAMYENELLMVNEQLEQRVTQRTAELLKTNAALKLEITERRQKDKKILQYQKQLRSLASELALAEEKERRRIASDLHDDIGQALAIIKMKFLELHCKSVLCEFKDNIEEIRVLLDEAIKDARSLTFEISPPVLYELGLEAAVQWLAENFQEKYKLLVQVTTEGDPRTLNDEVKATMFKGVRELLVNAIKHSQVSQVWVRVMWADDHLKIEVRDNGVGFDKSRLVPLSIKKGSFGLFSIKERIGHLGGSLEIDSMPGQGARATLIVPWK